MKKLSLLSIAFFLFVNIIHSQKPKTWIISDGTKETLQFDNEKGHLGDPDDISAVAGYLLMSNMFDTRAIVLGSTHHKELKNTPNTKQWAEGYFAKAYAKDLPQLNKKIGGYQEQINYIQSSIKETAEVYNPERTYNSLKEYASVQA